MSIKIERYNSETISESLINEMALLYWSDFVDEELRNSTPEFYSTDRFRERVSTRYIPRPDFQCVIAREKDQLVGFVTAANLRANDIWWKGVNPNFPNEYLREDGKRTMAIFDLLVDSSYRKSQIASLIHKRLLDHSTVERITLLSSRPQQPAHSIWLHWGYKIIGSQQFDQGPKLDLFMLDRT